jgi:hypothetical protein
VISLNLVLAGLRLGLKNRQVGEKWVSDDCSYLCKGLDDIIERSCQAWNEILSEDGFIKNLCSREWSFLV